MISIMRPMKLNKAKIEKELKRLGWTKEDLAKAMDKPRTAIYAYYKRADRVSLKTVRLIAKALDLDPKDLLV